MKPLADAAIKNQQTDMKVNFIPARFENTFLQWMNNIEDWCISRQLWWGHRIPAYYHKETGEVIVSMDPPKDMENYEQDADVLDTWFSSALWPFSTMGWPEETADLDRYFPTSTFTRSVRTARSFIFSVSASRIWLRLSILRRARSAFTATMPTLTMWCGRARCRPLPILRRCAELRIRHR